MRMKYDKTIKRHDKSVVQPIRTSARRVGMHYKLSPQSESLAMDFTGQPYVDRNAMSARAVISTSTIDRVGDVLIPSGCQLTHYRKNPVVLWAHGLEGIGHPIGTSLSPDGQLAIVITENEVQATSWFSQSLLAAAQIFELIDEGIVRATSVRETPIKSHLQHDSDAGDILIVEEWDLEEWSWCAVGVNPDALAKTLHRNRLGGRPIVPSIKKSLIAVAPTFRRLGVGFQAEKSMTEASPTDNGTVMDQENNPLTQSSPDDNDWSNQPYGSTVVAAAHASLVSACQNIQQAMGPLENPAVKEGLRAILIALQEQVTALEGMHVQCYPDQPALKDNDADDGDSLKAFLDSGHVASLQLFGLGARLKSMISSGNLSASQRRTLTTVAQQLSKIVSQSKSQQSADVEAKSTSLQKSILELSSLVDSLHKRSGR